MVRQESQQDSSVPEYNYAESRLSVSSLERRQGDLRHSDVDLPLRNESVEVRRRRGTNSSHSRIRSGSDLSFAASNVAEQSSSNSQSQVPGADAFTVRLHQAECPLLKDLVVELKSVDWHQLGTQLGVAHERLDKIDDDYRLSETKLNHMLYSWLENEQNPSWQKICEALRRIGNHARLARKLTIQYCSFKCLKSVTVCCQHHGKDYISMHVQVDISVLEFMYTV